MNRSLWVAQVILMLLFISTGVMKLMMPAAGLRQMTGLPGVWMHFVSLCEILGGLGLVLPGTLRKWRGLTPIAAACLEVVMVGAVTVTIQHRQPAMTLILPVVTGILLAWILLARRSWAVPAAERPASAT